MEILKELIVGVSVCILRDIQLDGQTTVAVSVERAMGALQMPKQLAEKLIEVSVKMLTEGSYILETNGTLTRGVNWEKLPGLTEFPTPPSAIH